MKGNELILEDSLKDKEKEKEKEEEFLLENIEDNLNLLIINKVTYQKLYIRINLVVQNEFIIENAIALVDSGAAMNCIQEGLVLTQYFEKIIQTLSNANGRNIKIKYKLNNVQICKDGICISTTTFFINERFIFTVVNIRYSILIYNYAF